MRTLERHELLTYLGILLSACPEAFEAALPTEAQAALCAETRFQLASVHYAGPVFKSWPRQAQVDLAFRALELKPLPESTREHCITLIQKALGEKK